MFKQNNKKQGLKWFCRRKLKFDDSEERYFDQMIIDL